MFHEVIIRAAAEGTAKIIRNGLAFTVMLGTIAGLIFVVQRQEGIKEREVGALKVEMKEMRERYEGELETMRTAIVQCHEMRASDQVRIARLEAIVERLQGQ